MSVIIPVYNVEKFIDRCLNSVFSQSIEQFEVIVVNDGCTDSSYQIIERYKKKYPQKLKLISQKNMGIAKARNLAMSIAKGEYISFVDADDFLQNNFLEILYKQAKENNADISCCNYYKYIESKRKKYKRMLNMPAGCYESTKALKTLISDNRIQYYVWNKLFKRSMLVKYNISFFDTCFEDVAFSVKSFYFANKVAVIDQALYYYVKHSNSTIADLNILKLEDYIKVLAYIRLFLQNQNSFENYRYRFFFHSIKVLNASCQNIIRKQGFSKKAMKNIRNAILAVSYYNCRKFKNIRTVEEIKKVF